MLRIRVPYLDETGIIAGGPQIKWPRVCACCGAANDGAACELKHRARESSAGDGNAAGLLLAWMTSGIDMSWQVPCCEACQVHSRKSRNPLRLKWTVVYGGIPTMFLGGFGLWSMGVANGDDIGDDPVGVMVAVGFVCLNFLAWYGVWRLVGGLMRWRGRGSTTPQCADSLAPVAANSDAQVVRFDFTNDACAESVAKANGLATEPARFTRIPVMVGDLLIRLGA
jgi:hypothetical protein